MQLFRLSTTTFVLLAIPSLPLFAQPPVQSAHDLVRDVMYNELHDRERDSHWEYRSQCLSEDGSLVREQVETDQGPVFRVIQRNGAPLDSAELRKEDERLDDYIHDSGQIAHVQHEHEQDEERLASIIALLPRAFLFRDEGPRQGDIRRISFRPDPAFVPSSYEERVVHALAGTLTVNVRLKRMIDMRGVVQERVNFGFGLLGRVDKGGTFEIHRRQVSPKHWKTDLVDVHIQGKVLLFKNIGKLERESRSEFRPVPSGTTLAEAEAMLTQPDTETVQAELTPAD
jgi:hypothetical protein